MDLDPAASGPREETFGGVIPSAQWLVKLVTFVDSTGAKTACIHRSYVCANVTLGVARLSPIVGSQTRLEALQATKMRSRVKKNETIQHIIQATHNETSHNCRCFC